MAELRTEMKNRNMFERHIGRDRRLQKAIAPGGNIRDFGENIKVVRKNKEGELEVLRDEPEHYLDCGDLRISQPHNSTFCSCGKLVCHNCLGLCEWCLKQKICRMCLEVFRENGEDGKDKTLLLCSKCHRKKRRGKILKIIGRIILFPFYSFIKKEEKK